MPHLINVEVPRPRIEAIRIVDMTSSNSWAEFAALFRSTRAAFLEHERAKTELKSLPPRSWSQSTRPQRDWIRRPCPVHGTQRISGPSMLQVRAVPSKPT
jgi:hypothetical protein